MALANFRKMLATAPGAWRPVLSIVVPAYNEEAVLEIFHKELITVLGKLAVTYEVLYVNDGSSDGTLSVLAQLMRQDANVGIVDLSRNFGKEAALTAGLDAARGEAVVVIDADLQDPPSLIGQFVQKWREGYDVVYAKRLSRDGETVLKKLTAYLFYRLIQSTTRVDIPADTGDYRLISRRALDALLTLRERHRFMKGLFAWIGFRQTAVEYRRAPRAAGDTKFNYWRLWNFALEGFTSFTIAPLKIASYLGLAISSFAFAYAAWIITKTLLYGDPVAGYPSLMVVVLLLGGVQLACLGILGEYIGRMFNEAKGRPLYLVNGYFSPAQNQAQNESLDFVVQLNASDSERGRGDRPAADEVDPT